MTADDDINDAIAMLHAGIDLRWLAEQALIKEHTERARRSLGQLFRYAHAAALRDARPAA